MRRDLFHSLFIQFLLLHENRRWNKWNVLRRIFTKKKKKKRKRKFTKPHIYTSNSPAYHFEICIGTVITHRCFCYTFFFLNKYPDVTFLDTLQIKWIFRAWPVVTGQSQFSVERFDFILNELYFKFDRV